MLFPKRLDQAAIRKVIRDITKQINALEESIEGAYDLSIVAAILSLQKAREELTDRLEIERERNGQKPEKP